MYKSVVTIHPYKYISPPPFSFSPLLWLLKSSRRTSSVMIVWWCFFSRGRSASFCSAAIVVLYLERTQRGEEA